MANGEEDAIVKIVLLTLLEASKKAVADQKQACIFKIFRKWFAFEIYYQKLKVFGLILIYPLV